MSLLSGGRSTMVEPAIVAEAVASLLTSCEALRRSGPTQTLYFLTWKIEMTVGVGVGGDYAR